MCNGAVKFVAHLVNQQVLHELVALELLTLLLEDPTDDSVEVAIGFLKVRERARRGKGRVGRREEGKGKRGEERGGRGNEWGEEGTGRRRRGKWVVANLAAIFCKLQ